MSVLFNNVKVGDTVHYSTPQGQSGKGKVVIHSGTHVVLNAGGKYGRPQVVTDKNYIKHSRDGKVVGALLSRLSHVKEAAKMSDDFLMVDMSKLKAAKKTDAKRKAIKRAARNYADARRVAKSLRKEEVVNELDKSTLDNYHYKAFKDFRKNKIRARNAHLVYDPDRLGGADGERADAEYKAAKAKVKKRAAGMLMARKKLGISVQEGRNADADADKVENRRIIKHGGRDPIINKQYYKAVAKARKDAGYKDPEKGWVGQSKEYYDKVEKARKGKLKEDAKDLEGRSSRVSKTKHAKKKLHELNTSTLAAYVGKALADRRKQESGKDMARRIHTPERAAYFTDKADKKIAKRTKGIKSALGKIASNLPAEPLKAHSDSEGARHGGWSGMESHEVNEVSAPGKEAWIKANKQRFIARYGKEKGLRVLYAKAWKDSKNEDVNEATGKFTALRRQFTRNENQNRHTKNAHLLATHFGTEEEKGKAKDALARLEKHGHSMDQDFVYDMHNKYAKKMYEARESEFRAARDLAIGAGIDPDKNPQMSQGTKKVSGHYLMKGGRTISGPHAPHEAVKAYKALSDSKGVKIVHHTDEGVDMDVTSLVLTEAAKVKKAAEKAISLAKKAKGNKHVDTEPSLNIQDKGGGGPMGGSHEGPEGNVDAKI